MYPGPVGVGAREDISAQATIFCNQAQNYQCKQVVTTNPYSITIQSILHNFQRRLQKIRGPGIGLHTP